MKSQVTIEGMEQLQARLEDPNLIGQPLLELLEDAANVGRDTAEKGIDGGTGIAVRSIGMNVQARSALVYTAMPQARAMSIEKGRPSGVPIEDMLAQLIRWRDAVGHPDLGIHIALGVRQRGVKGRFFMAAAREKVAGDLPRLVSGMAKKVENIWKQGRR